MVTKLLLTVTIMIINFILFCICFSKLFIYFRSPNPTREEHIKNNINKPMTLIKWNVSPIAIIRNKYKLKYKKDTNRKLYPIKKITTFLGIFSPTYTKYQECSIKMV